MIGIVYNSFYYIITERRTYWPESGESSFFLTGTNEEPQP